MQLKQIKVGLFGINHQTKKTVKKNENLIFGTASLIKVAIAGTMFDMAEKQQLNIDKKLPLAKFQHLFNLGKFTNGCLAFLPKNESISLRFTCTLMLGLSDNPATNLILNFVNQKKVNDFLKNKGFLNTRLTTDILNPAKLEKEKNLLGLTTPKEMALIFQRIVSEKILRNSKNLQDFKNMLTVSYPETIFSRFLPIVWNVPDKQVKIKKIFAKDGSFPEFALLVNTASFITDKNQQITISVFTQGIKNDNGRQFPSNLNPEHPANLFISKMTQKIFKHLS